MAVNNHQCLICHKTKPTNQTKPCGVMIKVLDYSLKVRELELTFELIPLLKV